MGLIRRRNHSSVHRGVSEAATVVLERLLDNGFTVIVRGARVRRFGAVCVDVVD